MTSQEESSAFTSIRSCTNNTRLIRAPTELILFVSATARNRFSTSSFVTVSETAARRTMVLDGVSVGTLDGIALGIPEGVELGTKEGVELGTSLGRT